MRVTHLRQEARPDALGVNDEPQGDLAGERDNLGNGTQRNGLQAPYRHHVGADKRRPKSIPELIAGWEFTELADRRSPGRLAKGVWR